MFDDVSDFRVGRLLSVACCRHFTPVEVIVRAQFAVVAVAAAIGAVFMVTKSRSLMRFTISRVQTENVDRLCGRGRLLALGAVGQRRHHRVAFRELSHDCLVHDVGVSSAGLVDAG